MAGMKVNFNNLRRKAGHALASLTETLNKNIDKDGTGIDFSTCDGVPPGSGAIPIEEKAGAGNESSQPTPDTGGPTPTRLAAWVGNQCPKCGSPVEKHGYQNCAAVCTSEWCLWSSSGAWMKDHQRKYVVIAHRGGDHENHSYPVGTASSVYDARKIAEAAEQYRGGKYACSIWWFRENESDMERADAEEPKIFQDCKPIPGWKTHAEKMVDEHRLVALCKEIVAKW